MKQKPLGNSGLNASIVGLGAWVQGLLTGKIGMDRQFAAGEFRGNTQWNAWLLPVNRRRVLDLLASWKDMLDKYQCTLSQLVLAWTATACSSSLTSFSIEKAGDTVSFAC